MNYDYITLQNLILTQYNQHIAILSVKYYGFDLATMPARIVQFGAWLKNRKENFAHTAMMYIENNEIKSLEITPKNIKACKISEIYFDKNFKGKVVMHFIPRVVEDYKDMLNYINNNIVKQKQYSVLKAFRAWFDVFGDQKDTVSKIYCTDAILDIIEQYLHLNLVSNNAEITPSELYEMLISGNTRLNTLNMTMIDKK